MKHTVAFILLLLIISCNSKKSGNTDDQASLKLYDTVSFHIDDSTFYRSKTIFQFEDNGKEYLFFQNINKGKPRILIYDIEKQQVHKSIPLTEEGPNGIIAIFGGWALDLNHFLVTTHAKKFHIINDVGEIQKTIQIWDGKIPFNRYCITAFFSFLSSPAIIKDSIVYFSQHSVGYPRKKEDWKHTAMFAYANLKDSTLGKTEFYYPSIFDEDEEYGVRSYEVEFSYAYTGKDVATSFYKTDSIYVSSDFKNIQTYNAKSRYFPHMHPKPLNVQMDLLKRLRKEHAEPYYFHLLYDKYRDVFYRFALMPYETPKNVNPMEEQTGREFSIIILNNKYEIIGETKFPGNTYDYRLHFIGKKGLYLSLNNQANPIFDENNLKFQCFTLQNK